MKDENFNDSEDFGEKLDHVLSNTKNISNLPSKTLDKKQKYKAK